MSTTTTPRRRIFHHLDREKPPPPQSSSSSLSSETSAYRSERDFIGGTSNIVDAGGAPFCPRDDFNDVAESKHNIVRTDEAETTASHSMSLLLLVLVVVACVVLCWTASPSLRDMNNDATDEPTLDYLKDWGRYAVLLK